jgi:hypothetical protein
MIFGENIVDNFFVKYFVKLFLLFLNANASHLHLENS